MKKLTKMIKIKEILLKEKEKISFHTPLKVESIEKKPIKKKKS